MANPVVTPCPADQWTKVATNILAGSVHIVDKSPDGYNFTYRDTGDAAPTLIDEAVAMTRSLEFELTAGVDVYIWPRGKAGSIRTDVYPTAPALVTVVP